MIELGNAGEGLKLPSKLLKKTIDSPLLVTKAIVVLSLRGSTAMLALVSVDTSKRFCNLKSL